MPFRTDRDEERISIKLKEYYELLNKAAKYDKIRELLVGEVIYQKED